MVCLFYVVFVCCYSCNVVRRTRQPSMFFRYVTDKQAIKKNVQKETHLTMFFVYIDKTRVLCQTNNTQLNNGISNIFILLNYFFSLLDSLVVQCWLRVREVPGSIPSQGPRHTKYVIKMVPVVSFFSTEHSKGKIRMHIRLYT